MLFAEGDQQALSWFYHSLYPTLCLFASHFVKDRAVAEELAADAFVKTWQQNNKLHTGGAIRAYLYTVVRHDCIRFIRKEQRRNRALRNIPFVSITEDTGFDKLVAAELSRHLYEALQQISPGASTVLKLHFLEGKSLTEIADQLNLSSSTIKTQKQRGLKALQKKILRPLLYIFSMV